ncbi:DUF397 domain-containing protein [Actinomadura sediminis]|uniref:DUF397 domain-containing protein n=1 Tax=Actinomadura sediminis TaxID=1038904 RepID=A0ABW3EKQ6_9ACTN
MTHLVWRKASRSVDGTSAQCVELAALPDGVGVRDSKDPDGGHLTLTPAAFRRLVKQWK